MITAIVAIGENREIGRRGELIWRIKEDLQRFKRLTMGHPVVMGRKTWESLPKALPGRTNIVITRRPDYKVEGAIVAHSVEEAIEIGKRCEGGENVFIIGGGEIYHQAIPLVDCMEVTHVYEDMEDADTFFPDFAPEDFVLTHSEGERETESGLKYAFESYERREDSHSE